MEFEKNAPVSDEQRKLADAEKVTLRPVHPSITPDDLSESAIASQHINGQPIDNIQTDVTQKNPTFDPTDDTTQSSMRTIRKQSHLMIIVIFGVATIIIAVSLTLILTLYK